MNDMVRDLMTPDPVTVPKSTTVFEVAKMMRDRNIGDVIVMTNGDICGIVTDRDIVVRTVADARHPASTHIGDICTPDVVSVTPEHSLDHAIEVMREKSIRRLVVMEEGKVVGILSLGDLAVDRDPTSLLGQLSAAEPQR